VSLLTSWGAQKSLVVTAAAGSPVLRRNKIKSPFIKKCHSIVRAIENSHDHIRELSLRLGMT
jgi:hypothetical protein